MQETIAAEVDEFAPHISDHNAVALTLKAFEYGGRLGRGRS